MKSGSTLVNLAIELERQLGTKKDLVMASSLLTHRTDAEGKSSVLITEPGEKIQRYGITELARRQLAEKLKIPFNYFERMRVFQSALLDENVNTWLGADPERRLIRTLDGNVRAVLSDRYRRLDNYDLADHVLPMLERLPDARFESVQLTATRMYLKVVTPRVKYEIAPGDFVQAGVVVTNSEVGHGTLSVQPLIFRLICGNGLIASDRSLRKTHIGRVLETTESNIVFRDDTLFAEDKALFLKVRDVVEEAVSEVSFRILAEKMQKTVGIKLSGDPIKTVEVLADRYALNESERTGVLRRLITDGDLTGYGLVNAVTAYSQELENYDRATDFEILGGKLIDLPSKEWEELAEAA